MDDHLDRFSDDESSSSDEELSQVATQRRVVAIPQMSPSIAAPPPPPLPPPPSLSAPLAVRDGFDDSASDDDDGSSAEEDEARFDAEALTQVRGAIATRGRSRRTSLRDYIVRRRESASASTQRRNSVDLDSATRVSSLLTAVSSLATPAAVEEAQRLLVALLGAGLSGVEKSERMVKTLARKERSLERKAERLQQRAVKAGATAARKNSILLARRASREVSSDTRAAQGAPQWKPQLRRKHKAASAKSMQAAAQVCV